MRKLIFGGLMAVAAITANAQNIQLHYDFGRNIYPDEEDGRQKVTVTVEQFKADKWGSWYYFVDLDLSRKFFKGAYTEISREFSFGTGSPFAAHFEYDGGPTMAIMPTSRRPGQYNCSTSVSSRAMTPLRLTIVYS